LGNPRELFTVHFQKQNNTPVNPEVFKVSQNYPNPFNPSTNISYDLPNEGKVSLEIFNLKGQLLQTLINEKQPAGHHQIEWNASAHSSGIYFYKLHWNEYTEIRKCVLMK
jgi:hypothetical protein